MLSLLQISLAIIPTVSSLPHLTAFELQRELSIADAIAAVETTIEAGIVEPLRTFGQLKQFWNKKSP